MDIGPADIITETQTSSGTKVIAKSEKATAIQTDERFMRQKMPIVFQPFNMLICTFIFNPIYSLRS